MYRRDQFSERSQQQQQQLGTSPSKTLLLLRCKTTIDELKLEVEKTEEEKCQIHRKFERLLKEFQDKERELDDGKAFTQGIIEELNRCKSDYESLKSNEEILRQENEQLRYSCQQIMEQNEQLRQFSEEFKLERDQIAEDLLDRNNKLTENQEYEITLQEKIRIQEKMIDEYRVELESREQEELITRRQQQQQVSNSLKRGQGATTTGVSISNLRTQNNPEQKIFDLQQHIDTLEQHIQRQDILIKKLNTQINSQTQDLEGDKENTEKDQLIKHQGQIIEKQAEQVKSVEKQLEDLTEQLKTSKNEYEEVYEQIQSILTENEGALKIRDDANSLLKAEITTLKKQIIFLESQQVITNSELNNQITYPQTARSNLENIREISNTIQGLQNNHKIKKNHLGLVSLIEEQRNSKNNLTQLQQILQKEQPPKQDQQINQMSTLNDEFLSGNTKQNELLSSPTDYYPSSSHHPNKNSIGRITHKTPKTEINQNSQINDVEGRIQQQSQSQQLTSQQLNYSQSTDSPEDKYQDYPKPSASFSNNHSLKEQQGSINSPSKDMAKINLSHAMINNNILDNKENTVKICQTLPTEQSTVRIKSEMASQRIPTAKKQRLSAVIENTSGFNKNDQINKNTFNDSSTNIKYLNKNISQKEINNKHGYDLAKENQVIKITERKRAESQSKMLKQTQSSSRLDCSKERLVSKERLKKQLESLEQELKLKNVENQLLKQGLSSSNLAGKPSRKIRAITSISYN